MSKPTEDMRTKALELAVELAAGVGYDCFPDDVLRNAKVFAQYLAGDE